MTGQGSSISFQGALEEAGERGPRRGRGCGFVRVYIDGVGR